MKNFKLIIPVLLIVLLFGACSEDFLDTTPKLELLEENFFSTPHDAELALIGCYDGLQRLNQYTNAFPIASEIFSDNVFGGTGHTDALGFQVMDEFDATRSAGLVNIFEDVWASYYRAIFRVNMLLRNIDAIDWDGNDDLKNSIIAEARFLRAYFYFDMVRLWERVPLLTEPTDENIPQSEPDEIYALIADDLLFAAENAPDEIRIGRADRWAAKSLLARVYLFYTGYYQKNDLVGKVSNDDALQGLEDVIISANYALVNNYSGLWPAASAVIDESDTTGLNLSAYAGNVNEEVVFAIRHNITSDWDGNVDGNHWIVMFGMRDQNYPPYGTGWGAGTVRESLYNAFEAGDPRREASIIAVEEEGLEDFALTGQREYTGYYTKKYIPLANPNGQDRSEFFGGESFMLSQYQDYWAIRYADVLLMAAELGSANAQQYFDEVRIRIGLSSKPANKENLIEERRFEFAFEGLRYWDLLRQGLDYAADAVEGTANVLNGGRVATKQVKGENLKTTRGFQQIPLNEITLSDGVLQQNKGWD